MTNKEIPHLKEREQYSKDMLRYAEPWMKWEWQWEEPEHPNMWHPCNIQPRLFERNKRYRRIPDTITIAGVEVEKPIKVRVYKTCQQVIISFKSAEQAIKMKQALKALLEVGDE